MRSCAKSTRNVFRKRAITLDFTRSTWLVESLKSLATRCSVLADHRKLFCGVELQAVRSGAKHAKISRKELK